MKIAYDAQIFYEQAYGGVSRYICEIASRISRFEDMDASITAPMHINSYLEHLPQELVSGFRLPGVHRLPLSLRAAGMLMGDVMLRAMAPELIHETYYFPYRLGPRRARRVLTIHDMIHEKLPSYFATTDRTPRFKLMAAKRADHIICVSEQTRRDLIDIQGTDPDKVSVVYHGVGLLAEGAGVGKNVPPYDQPFLLYVGPRGGYKNFSSLLRAYAASTRLQNDYLLVCFGGGNFSAAERETIGKLGLGDGRVVQLGGGDQVLAALYRSALAFVYPSLYEGFGIPPLEAMTFNCPVICGKGGSIAEVVGDAGEYFDPTDVENMRHVMESIAESASRRDALIAKGRQRLTLFSWDRCAQETAAIYRKLA